VGERRTGRTLAARLRDLADALLAVLLAPRCLACERPLDAPLAGPMCPACWAAVPPLPGPFCGCCSEPLPGGLTTTICDRCGQQGQQGQQGLQSFQGLLVRRTAAAGRYEGPLRAAIQAMKYDGRRSLAGRLAALMRERGGDVLAGADAVVPVPLHRSRRRQRGFNQAADLARGLGLPVIAALWRTRATGPQADLPAEARSANVAGAFAATRGARRCRGAVVVLVDDVATTGATLDACAAVLLAAGAAEVRAITAARAVKLRR
jgi:ComF family protein